MYKIAVLNDIHSNYYLLDKVLKEIEKDKVDDYIVCGDIITDGFENNEVIEILKSKTNNIIVGNREASIIEYDGESWNNHNQWKSMLYTYNNLKKENIDFLATLPEYKIIFIENKKICFSHGSPYNIRDCINVDSYEIFDKLIKDYDCDIYLFAHTHKIFCVNYKNRLFINSGSINCPTHVIPASTYGIICIDNDKVNYIQKEYKYDFDKIKEYYLNSEYYKYCFEWCNLIIYTLKYATDFCNDFIDYINKYNDNNDMVTNEIWEEKFKEYMKIKNLDIL